jgi:hypothetical protein
MREKPVLFSTPMVKAILNTNPGIWPAEPVDPDRPYKWMTRRIIKPQPDKDDPCVNYTTIEGYQTAPEYAEKIWAQTEQGESLELKPRYEVGDILWVRETFTKTNEGEYIYRSDPMFDGMGKGDFSWSWTSPLFLPREAARIFLEVKSVRIERIQEISYDDMAAEGISFEDNEDFNMAEHYQIGGSPIQGGSPERFAYASLWDGLNAKRGYPWDGNPWVWVYEFMRVL